MSAAPESSLDSVPHVANGVPKPGFLQPETVFFAAIFALLLLTGRSKLLQDSDTFWHIAVGRQILETRQFTEVDTFSCSRAGESWIPHQWLGECLLAAVDRMAGFDGLVVLTAGILAAVYAAAGGRLVRNGLHWLWAALFVALALSAGAHNFHARPHVASLALLAVLFTWLCDVELRRSSIAGLWRLIPLCLLWTNLHGGVLGGLATAGIVFAGWAAAWLLNWPGPVSAARQALALGGILIAASATVLINPYGTGTPQAWMAILDADLQDLIIEHAPLNPARPEGVIVLLFAAIHVGVLAGLRERPRVTWLLPLAWFWLSLTTIRHAALFGVVTVIAIADMLPRTRWADWFGKRGFYAPASWVRPGWLAVAGGGALFAMVFMAAIFNKQLGTEPSAGRAWAGPDPSIWPEELLPTIRQFANHSPQGTAVFNDVLYDGFLIYNTPSLHVFIDGRCELYGDGFLRAYAESRRQPAVLDEWTRTYNFRAALVRTDSPFDGCLTSSPDWMPRERTPTATFYVRSIDPGDEPATAER